MVYFYQASQIEIYIICYDKDCEIYWIDLNLNQKFHQRSNLFNYINTSLGRIDKNFASNRIRRVNFTYHWIG
jgi:hypothetical protein